MAPWLSVLMPTYNGAPFIADALDSVVAQGDAGIEVVVADDGSTDGTLEVVRRYQSRLALRIVQAERVGNWAAGTNVALRAAVGKYACVLHQDDFWLPGRAAAVRQALPFSLLVHPALLVGPGGKRLGFWRLPLPAGAIAPTEFIARLLVQNFLAMPSPVFLRAAALPAGLDESLWYAADWDLWLRLGAGGPVLSLAGPLAAFRIHPASQTLSRDLKAEDFRLQLRTVLERHFAPWAEAVSPRAAKRTREVAEFSVEVNVALAAAHRGKTGCAPAALLRRFLLLGPRGWARYLRDSRLHERVWARRRA